MNVAIIPARGGSKRIPRKNIKNFHGKPIIAYSIIAAKESRLFDRIIVSTDDDEIANISLSFGAEVPFIRPFDISDDYSTTNDVIKHSIHWLNKNECSPEYICCIYPTAPFIQIDDIVNSYMTISGDSDINYCFPVCEFPYPIQRAMRCNENGRVEMFQPQYFTARSQDLDNAYHDAGQFYWGRANAYINDEPIFSTNSIPLIISRKRVIDLDNQEDWDIAVSMYEYLSQ